MKLIWRKKPATIETCIWQEWNNNHPNPDALSIAEEDALRLSFATHLERVCSCYKGKGF